LRFVEDTELKNEPLKWDKYTKFLNTNNEEVKTTCKFDTKFAYQNKELEDRYLKFKEERDKFLLDPVPLNKTFEH
jgi:hypothetical protein